MFFGLQTLGHQKVDVFPEFAPVTRRDPDRVPRALAVGGRVARDRPAGERAAGRARASTEVESESVPQLSAIFLYFKNGTDVLQARQLVQERLAAAAPTLPIVGCAAGAVPDRLGDEPRDADRA